MARAKKQAEAADKLTYAELEAVHNELKNRHYRTLKELKDKDDKILAAKAEVIRRALLEKLREEMIGELTKAIDAQVDKMQQAIEACYLKLTDAQREEIDREYDIRELTTNRTADLTRFTDDSIGGTLNGFLDSLKTNGKGSGDERTDNEDQA